MSRGKAQVRKKIKKKQEEEGWDTTSILEWGKGKGGSVKSCRD